jgi:hypothetical protein
MSHKHIKLSDDGIIQNVISVNDDELITRDIMAGHHVQAILDSNKRVRNDNAYNKKAQGRLAARIPLPVYHMWSKEWKASRSQYMTWQTFLAAKINSRDYSYLKTQPGKIHVPTNVRTAGR